ncbi:ABC transporter permease [Candidatus Babeliales bacterium]|nr:ABC transporter permease [Candidatus Babeliales bacterium]
MSKVNYLQIKSYLRIFWQLLKTDLQIFKQASIDETINSIITAVCTVVVFSYVFSHLGMDEHFGVFIAVGVIVSAIFWSSWTTSTVFIADLEGNRTITYFLTLPVPNYLILIKQIVSYAIKSALTGATILPVIKLLLWNQLSFANFSLIKFVLVFALTSLFIGSLSLLITSFIKSVENLSNVSMRFLFPMWFFGGANYSWEILYKISPKLAIITLINPLLYAMEGMRVAVLGQQGYINFWICLPSLIGFTFLFGWWGIARLKKRLDFV